MRHGSLLLLASAAISLCGCETNRELHSRIELLERDLRWQEDEIYYLQDQLTDQEQRLDSVRRDRDSKQRALERLESRGGHAPPPASVVPKGNKPSNGGGKPPKATETPDSGLPKIELGPESKEPPPSSSGGRFSAPGIFSAGFARSAADDYPTDDVVASIVLNPRLTGGHNSDGRPGDDGIMVVIEPRNSAGQFVPLAGDVSIDLVDPTLDGVGGRYARWEFSHEEVEARLQKTILAKGYQFELRWPNGPPKNAKMKIEARYATREGRRLLADKGVSLRLPLDANDGPLSAPSPVAQRPERMILNESSDGSAAPPWKPFR